MINSFYIQRINKVIDYIEEHLNEKLTLIELARVAMFSKYHFHRIFKIVSGETLNNYIKRLKMEKAYRQIQSGLKTNISEIADEFGYQSTANFSRDFREYFGIAPSEAKNAKSKPIERKLNNTNNVSITFKGIENIPDKKLLYKRVNTGYNTEIISTAFNELYQFAIENNLLQSIEQIIGIGYDDPDYTPVDKCRYDACITLNSKVNFPKQNNFNRKILKGGKYAVFLFEGQKEQFFAAWDIIFKEWVLNSKYVPLDRPHLEMYLPSDAHENGIYKANLCLPVKPIKITSS